MIVLDTAGRLFRVRDTGDANLAHVWFGTEMKRTAAGYEPKKNARESLVRKVGCTVQAEAR